MDDAEQAGTATAGPDDGDPGVAVVATFEQDRPWSWYLVRVSGIFLAVLVPLHFAVTVVRDDIGRTTIATVTERFADGRWQAIEWITLVLALVHAFLGLRRALLATTWRPVLRDGTIVALGVVAVFLVGALTWAMLGLS